MSKFSDYINGLEGKQDLDPLIIARDLTALHDEEIETNVAKISTLETAITDKDTLISERDREITVHKARNYDLFQQIPAKTNQSSEPESAEIDGSTITPDDLFGE